MSIKMSYKTLVFAVFTVLAGAFAPSWAGAAEVKEVAPGVYAFVGTEGATNSGFVVTGDGVVVIDTQGPAELAEELKQAIAGVTDEDVAWVINTHYHGDHTFGNQFFSGAPIVSHRWTREALRTRDSAHRTRFRRFFGEESLTGFVFTLPDATFEDRMTLYVGRRKIEIVHTGPAHTGGDAYVYLPAEKVVFTGDLMYSRRLPLMSDGSPAGALAATDELLSLDATVFVPGHGPVGGKPELVEYRRFILELIGEVRRLVAEGHDLEEVKKRVELPEFSDWGRYDEWLGLDAGVVYRELTGEAAR